MPSLRRAKLVAFICSVIALAVLYFSNNAQRVQSQDFYTSTAAAMDAATDAVKEKGPNDAMKQILLEAQKAAKGPNPPENRPQSPLIPQQDNRPPVEAKPNPPPAPSPEPSTTGEKSIAGRKMMSGGEQWDVNTGKQAAMVVDKEGDSKKQGEPETKEEHEIEVELNSILKKSPIIIFSKTYCPYSRKAKSILLETYLITPAPYVVEIDTHPLGPGLQAALEKKSGRRTVPNILINGKSIGGGDEVQDLDQKGELLDKIKSMGGKRIVEAKKRE